MFLFTGFDNLDIDNSGEEHVSTKINPEQETQVTNSTMFSAHRIKDWFRTKLYSFPSPSSSSS